jgi:rhamnulokinase
LGTELPSSLINDDALKLNFTNEIDIEDTFRLLKNIMGLWIIQECHRTWDKKGNSLSFDELNYLIDQEEPLSSFIDPDHPMFLNPEKMPSLIQKYCQLANQKIPETKGQILRIALESLAMKYRYVLEQTEMQTQKTFAGLHIVVGGTKNRLLCHFTANAIKRPVWAVRSEASAIGNMLMQYISTGEIENIAKGREIVRNSFPIDIYHPQDSFLWDKAFTRFCE